MNESVHGSVEDNGNSVPADVSVNGVSVLLDDDHEESIGSPQRSDSVGSSTRVESPGGSVHSTRKGFGLKKWRRIKRDGPVKDEAAPVDDGSKLLKRGLTGLVNPPSKHLDLSSIEARQSSEGSVGSVNMVHHHPGVANGFSPDPGCMFTVGQTFEKSEEHSGSAIGGKNVVGGKVVSGSQGKNWSDTIKKASEERVNTEKEKPCSSLDSDLRSSDFVFSSSAVSVANHGEKDERLMMNHIEGFSKECQVREEVQTYSRSENGSKEEDGDESKKNNNHRVDKDPLADSIRSFAALQEALWKEVQIFQELGKDSIPLDSNIDELGSSDQPRNENWREDNSTSSGSKALILKEKLKHLEHKLEEARAALEAKEARIQELENSKIESELEGIFQRKIETEIEHLMLTRSLNSSLQVLQQPEKVHSLSDDSESNHGHILGKSYNKRCDDSSSPAKYDDLVRNSALFWEKLRVLLGFTSKTLKLPTVGGSTLDLHRLFIEVTSRGGIERVIKDRKWKEVIGAFNFPTTITSASFVLRKYYLKFLYQLEHVYYLEKPVSSIQLTDEAMKSLVNESPNPEEGIEEAQVGYELNGFIDGKFDNGYLVTMKMGSQELKGVIYHIPNTPSQSQQTMETPSAIVPSAQRRHRKKSKLAQVDSQKPKCHRSGYNFFFAEQYARLKPEYHGQERTITKKIGHMWSNLTESEKQVYQDKGVKDVERYRTEMLEYKSSHESGAAASTVAQ